MQVTRQTQIIYLETYRNMPKWLSGQEEKTYIPIHKSIEEMFGKGTFYEIPEYGITLKLLGNELKLPSKIRTVGYLNSEGILVTYNNFIEMLGWGPI